MGEMSTNTVESNIVVCTNVFGTQLLQCTCRAN